jgi:hypothetical protein
VIAGPRVKKAAATSEAGVEPAGRGEAGEREGRLPLVPAPAAGNDLSAGL